MKQRSELFAGIRECKSWHVVAACGSVKSERSAQTHSLKKNHKPAKVVLDCLTQRHSTVKVHANQKKAKVDAVAAKAAAVAHHQSQLDRVAALEDAVEAEDTTRSLEDLRPDLHIGHKSV